MGKDGIFMASNVSNTCAIWDCEIVDNEKQSVIGKLGNMEHIRSALPKERRQSLKGGQLYWMTDKTPHEALPMDQSAWRQFFRLVSSNLGIWYQAHSTENPMGIKPDKKITKIIKENKFE